MNRTNRRGFTLIELLLVIVILAILGGVGAYALFGTRDQAKIDTTLLKIDTLKNAVVLYSSHIGHYPNEEEGGLQALVTLPTFEDEDTAKKWAGPYLDASKEPLKDAWGNDFMYTIEEEEVGVRTQQVVRISSMGPDGLEGTDDDIKGWKEDDGGM